MQIDELVAEVEATRSVPSPDRCRAIRRDAGISLTRLADALGVSGQTIANWESGRSRPSASNAASYVQVLHALEQIGKGADSDDRHE